MAGKIDARLDELGITLPEPVAPVAAYVPFVQTGNLVFVSGQVPIGPNGTMTGHLTQADHAQDGVAGEALTNAIAAARLCALNVLAHVKTATGDLDRVKRVVKLTGFVNCDGTFTQHPQVINGASELMGQIFGDAGQHARAAVGSSSLPLGVVVEVEGIFEVE
ncbi:MAG: RidA family protein [Pseudomonadota bacterium]